MVEILHIGVHKLGNTTVFGRSYKKSNHSAEEVKGKSDLNLLSRR
jgi:hypothetical protein